MALRLILLLQTTLPYDRSTEEDALDWCWADGVDKDAIEASLAANIEAQKNPTQATGVPW